MAEFSLAGTHTLSVDSAHAALAVTSSRLIAMQAPTHAARGALKPLILIPPSSKRAVRSAAPLQSQSSHPERAASTPATARGHVGGARPPDRGTAFAHGAASLLRW